MRGKPGRPALFESATRIIPAHAGQTFRRTDRIRGHADHPRACGANLPSPYAVPEPSGSSPRMRGKRSGLRRRLAQLRIIPAHAGQTTRRSVLYRQAPDHPRACGANPDTVREAYVEHGSSPRMRGKQLDVWQSFQHVRIIPAHAGQTPAVQRVSRTWPDHPRACGANGKHYDSSSAAVGSSPRMRGKQSDFMRKLLSAGPSIIGFAQWLQSSYYCSCLQSSAKTPISRGTTPTSLFLGFQNSITLLLLT